MNQFTLGVGYWHNNMKRFLVLIAIAIVCVIPTLAGSNKETNYRTALVMAYSPANSVYEDENIKLEIYGECLWATNKTDKTIFIDLSQSFAIHNGSSYPLFEKEQNEKHASKKKASTSIDEFISIAPSVGARQNETFICQLAGGIYGKYSTTETPSGNFSDYEERMLNLIDELLNESLSGDPKGKEYLGSASRHLIEEESISNIGASIAYSFNKRSESWTPVTISTWVSDVYISPYYVEMPQDLKKNDKKGFGVKKTEAAKVHVKANSPFEFEGDKSPVIVCDWVGNYKKGTFELNPTRISKKSGLLNNKLIASFANVFSAGMYGFLLTDLYETYYKSVIHFAGENDDWGKMKYMKSDDLSKFDNK